MTLCISSTVLLLLLLFLHLPTSSSFSGPTTRPNPTIVDNTPIIDPGTGKYVYQLSDNNFTEAVTADTRGEGPMFVEFYTQWCGHCKALAPVWMQLADELRGRVRVAAMDISENPLTMEQLGVTAFPTLIYVIRNRVYTFDGTKGRSLIALKHFALGGFNEVDWKDLGKPPKPRTAGGGTSSILYRLRRILQVTFFFWTRATLPSVITFFVGTVVGMLATVVAIKAAGNRHIAELEDELIDRLNELEDRAKRKDRGGNVGGNEKPKKQ